MRRDALMARPPMQPALRWGMTAASLAAVMLVTALGWRVINPLSGTRAPGQAIPANAAPSLVAGAGGPSTFVLADGSRVTLAANAALAVAYGGQRRAVRLLRGDAFFSVAHDAARAFTADIGDRTLSDLGTEFDAHLDGRTLSVTLIKGSVAVRSPGGASPAILTPGERLDASPGQADQISAVDVDSVPSWRIRDLEFHDQPLDAAISAVNRYGGAPARIVDPSVRGLRVSGQFRTGDPTRFAATLSDIYPLRLTHRADGGVDIAKR
jgi:transmembrane sensor